MVFKIAVCIKQVPDTNDIKWTENNTIQREGLESIINPFDVSAIELALKAKKLLTHTDVQAEVNAVTMGPLQAEEVLRTALAMGCDNAYLLSDKRFSAADTLATAYTLSCFISNILPDTKLIICGQQAIDGDTAQTPSSLAQKLNIAQATNITSLEEINNVYSIWSQETRGFSRVIKSGFPLMISTVINNSNIQPDINGYIKAQDSQIAVFDASAINADFNKIGLKGSPTKVKKAFVPEIKRQTVLYENMQPAQCAEFIFEEIEKCRTDYD